MTKYILTADVIGHKKTIYAKKGDTVNLIGDRGRALIVEDQQGNRFSINSKNIISIKNEIAVLVHKKADHIEKHKKAVSKANIAQTLF